MISDLEGSFKNISRIIAIASQKGVTSKTTTCRNLATLLSKKGYKILIVYSDNQYNLTDCFGIENPERLEITLFDRMKKVILQEDLPNKEEYIIIK